MTVLCVCATGLIVGLVLSGSQDASPGNESLSNLDELGDPVIRIDGLSRVPCFGPIYRYEVKNSGGSISNYNWDTQVGLHSPWWEGPDAYISFDLLPGTYEIRVTVNDQIPARKIVTVLEAPGCDGQTPSPQVVGDLTASCGESRAVRISNTGLPIIDGEWESQTLAITDQTSNSATLDFPSTAGQHEVSYRAIGEFGDVITTRRFYVSC